MVVFVIWAVVGMFFIVMGIYDYCTPKKTAFGFWANGGDFPVENEKKYNRALGKLWIVFGIIFILTGIPLLAGQNSPYVLLSIFGAMMEVIGVMAVYTMVLEKKYRKKK